MKLIILNKNNFGKEIKDLSQDKYAEIMFLDDKQKDTDILSECADYFLYIDDDTYFYPAFENNELRFQWIHRLFEMGANVATIISNNVQTGNNSKIIAGSVIYPDVVIKDNVFIKTGCIIKNNCVIEDNVILEENCVIENNVTIKSLNRVQRNTVIPPNTTIESGQLSLEEKYSEPKWESRHRMLSEEDEEKAISYIGTDNKFEKELREEKISEVKDKNAEILKAVKESGKSLDEILAFLKKDND